MSTPYRLRPKPPAGMTARQGRVYRKIVALEREVQNRFPATMSLEVCCVKLGQIENLIKAHWPEDWASLGVTPLARGMRGIAPRVEHLSLGVES